MKAVCEVRGVSKRFGDREVLRDVNLTVNEREVVCVLGGSGSGKTTLLRCVNHLVAVDTGTVRVLGELVGYRLKGDELTELADAKISEARQRIGLVFQQFNLFQHMTVLGNVMEGPVHVLGRKPSEVRREALSLLGRVGLTDHKDNYPRTLSGGQQQRVAIARALAMRPALMLFDEPTSALDPALVNEVLDTIKALAADGMSMIVVTHELAFAREVADKVVIMGSGEVIREGPASMLDEVEAKELY